MKLFDLSLFYLDKSGSDLGFASYGVEMNLCYRLDEYNVETYGKLVHVCGFTSLFSAKWMFELTRPNFKLLVSKGYRSAAISRKLAVLILPLVLSLGTM
ncbi:hypothetical protein L1887_17650 [Cichorium endivia]|nr:hypothetical protein L1887_17650 [Cichorium endivia]